MKQATAQEETNNSNKGFHFSIADAQGRKMMCSSQQEYQRQMWIKAVADSAHWLRLEKNRKHERERQEKLRQSLTVANAVEVISEANLRIERTSSALAPSFSTIERTSSAENSKHHVTRELSAHLKRSTSAEQISTETNLRPVQRASSAEASKNHVLYVCVCVCVCVYYIYIYIYINCPMHVIS